REVFVSVAASSGSPVTEQVTRDELFDPTLDEVGLFVFTPSGRLLFSVGDADAVTTGILARMDVFGAELDPASGLAGVRNLAHSPGESLPPFTAYGGLDAHRVAFSPVTEGVLLHDQDATCGRLFEVRWDASNERLDNVASLDLLELAGQNVLLAVQ